MLDVNVEANGIRIGQLLRELPADAEIPMTVTPTRCHRVWARSPSTGLKTMRPECLRALGDPRAAGSRRRQHAGRLRHRQ